MRGLRRLPKRQKEPRTAIVTVFDFFQLGYISKDKSPAL
jgi:hypothetical protein